MPRTFEEQYRNKLNVELVEVKEDMETLREKYGQILIEEQRLQGMKTQLEFEQQQQEGRLNQLKEMLNPKLKERRKPPKPPTPPKPVVEKPTKPTVKKPITKKSKGK